jgi:hypothetical protein
MAHDGVEVENHVTGEVTSISSREMEIDFSPSEDSASTVEAVAYWASAERHHRKAKRAAKTDAKTAVEGSATQQRATSRLHFVETEKIPNGKLRHNPRFRPRQSRKAAPEQFWHWY